MKTCHKCGRTWDGVERLQNREACEGCGAYLHCCLNCKLYNPHAHNHCQSPTTEFVSDVEMFNHCDEFIFADSGDQEKKATQADTARDAWKNLFGH